MHFSLQRLKSRHHFQFKEMTDDTIKSKMIGKNAAISEDRVKAQGILYSLESFEFAFMAHLMLTIFGYTNDLCLALQRRDRDIVNVMSLVSLTKDLLQNTRDNGWETLLDKVSSFCTKYDIVVHDMDAPYIPRGRSKRFVSQVTNSHYFRFDLFVEIIDLQVQELNERFDEANTELLICMACLSPKDGFSSYHKEKVLKLATFYPSEFSSIDLMTLECQLDIFIQDMQRDDRFQNLRDLGALLMMLIETKKNVTYPAIFLLIKLMLILPVATASVERVFSGMTYVKNKLRNSMSDQLLNDCLVTFIEKDIFLQVPDDDIIDRFQNMKLRRIQLKLYGASIKEFHLRAGAHVHPCSTRLMLIRQNLGSNWSSLYYHNYELSGYQLISPVLGLLAYNVGATNFTTIPSELGIQAGIAIDFSNTTLQRSSGIIPLCARFDEDGKVSLSNQARPNVCVVTRDGHFGLVVESPLMPFKRKVSRWKIAIGSSIGAALGAFLLSLLVIALFVNAKKKARMEEMERRAYEEEALQVSMVGHVRTLTASGTRTVPTIEHQDYRPPPPRPRFNS